MPSMPPLGRDLILTMLREVGQILHDQGLSTTIHVVGGAAIALTLKNERITHDVDAVLRDHPAEFLHAAHTVARHHRMNTDWIGDDVSPFISRNPVGQEHHFVFPGLSVYVASPEHILAMKVRAAATRDAQRDLDDIIFLVHHLQIRTPEEVARLAEHQFEGIYYDSVRHDEYLDVARFAFQLDELHQKMQDFHTDHSSTTEYEL